MLSKNKHALPKSTSPKVNVALGESFLCVFFMFVAGFPFSFIIIFSSCFLLVFFWFFPHTHTSSRYIYVCRDMNSKGRKFNVVIIFEFIFFHKSLLPSRKFMCVRFFCYYFFYIQISFGCWFLVYWRVILVNLWVIRHHYESLEMWLNHEHEYHRNC